MQPIKAAFACLLLAIVVVLCLNAQPTSAPIPAAQAADSTVAPATANAATAETTESQPEAVPAAAPPLFYIGPPLKDNVPSIFSTWWPKPFSLPVTNSMVCTWIVAAVILVLVRATTPRHIKEVPSGMQNIMEALVEGWEGLIGDILDPRVARWVFPFATTFFIFIVMSNFVDLVPGVGSIGSSHNGHFTPFFRPPTSDANLTVAMAGIFLVMSLYWAVRYNGVRGLIKHIFGVKMDTSKWLYPFFLALFIFIGAMEVVSIVFARPVSLAMRLYGNIFAGETILEMTFHAKSFALGLLLSICTYFYETFVCLVQAFVFALLVVAFVGTLCMHTDEEHGQ